MTLKTRPMGAGFSFTSGGKKYKVTFKDDVTPHNDDSPGVLDAALGALSDLSEHRRAQQVCADWIWVLQRPPDRPRN